MLDEDFPELKNFCNFKIKSKEEIKDFDVKQFIEYFFTDVYKNLCNRVFEELEENISKSKRQDEENKLNEEKANKLLKLCSELEKALKIAKENNKQLSDENINLTKKLKEKIEIIIKEYSKFLDKVKSNNSDEIQIDFDKIEESNIVEILKKINLNLNDLKKKA